MEPTREMLSKESKIQGQRPWGELVIQNGRLAGKHQPLESPLILVGQSSDCDIRLHSKAIKPLHCALVFTTGGVVIRELQGRGGITVNRDVVSNCPLYDGDEIGFGPFQFQIRLSAASPLANDRTAPPEPDSLDEALSIQAAAVVAQQAALNEEEVRLQQRRVALERQEAQLASHLEEKRRRLVELRNQARQAHASVKEERARQKQESEASAKRLDSLRGELDEGRLQLQSERKRLFNLRQRLRHRMHRHWAAERAAMRKREAALDYRRQELDQANDRLQEERQTLVRSRMQFNGETELSKRQIQDAWNQLYLERTRWEEQRTSQQADLKEQASVLLQREIDLTDAARDLAEQRRRWEETQHRLQKEADGLDSRIRNQRRKLLDQDGEKPKDGQSNEEASTPTLSSSSAQDSEQPGPKAHPPATGEFRRQIIDLDQLACELADQRLYLAEQCERFHRARQKWQQDRDTAVAALEPLAQQLAEREKKLFEREQSLETEEIEYHARLDKLAQQRQHLDAWQARLALRTVLWESERDRFFAEIQSREDKAELSLTTMTQLRRRWQQARTEELEHTKIVLSACEQLRQECTRLRDHWLRRGSSLDLEQRTLAERAMALEEYRFTFVRQSDDPNVVNQRLKALRDRWNADFETSAHPMFRERQQLLAETERLEKTFTKLQTDLEAIHEREAERARRELELEQAETSQQSERELLQSQLNQWKANSEIYERQARELSEEVERLARVLLDENDPGLNLSNAA